MAVVRFYRTMPLANGNFAPVTGWLRFTPTGRRVIVGDPDNTVLPIAFSVDLENGAASVDLAATGADWVWKIDEFISKRPGDARVVQDRTYYVAVPTGAGPVDDTDLVRVNPGDYTPIDTTKNVSLAELDSRVTDLEAGGVGGGSDAAVAGYVGDTGSQTRTALNAAIAEQGGGGLTYVSPGRYSSPALPTPDTTAPSAVTGLTAVAPTTNSVPLSWTAATDDVAVTGYEYSLDGSTWTSTGSTGTTYTVTGLTASTAYTIRLRAFDAAGNRGGTATVSATTAAPADTTAPSAPGSLAGTAGNTTMDLTWTAATDNVAVTAYRVSKDNGATWLTSSVTGLSYQVTGLTALTSYTFAVQARDAAGNWGPSATLTKSTTESIPSGSYNPAVMALSPSFYFPLDEAAGSASVTNHGSINTRINDATVLTWAVPAGITLGAAGIGDGATSADITDTTKAITSQTDMNFAAAASTFVAVIRPDTLPASDGSSIDLFGFGSRANAYLSIRTYKVGAVLGTHLSFFLNNVEVAKADSVNLTAGNRYVIGASFNGTRARLYINGTMAVEAATTAALAIAWRIFRIGQGTVPGMDGRVAGVAWFKDVELTDAQHLSLAQAAGLA